MILIELEITIVAHGHSALFDHRERFTLGCLDGLHIKCHWAAFVRNWNYINLTECNIYKRLRFRLQNYRNSAPV